MKTVPRITCLIALSLSLTLVGCQTSDKLSDGIFFQDETGRSPLRITINDPQGRSHQFKVRECTNVTVKAIAIYSLKPYEDAFQLQIDLMSSDNDWSDQIPVLVIMGKPYLELTRAVSEAASKSPVSISLKVPSEAEAKLIKERLAEKFKIVPR